MATFFRTKGTLNVAGIGNLCLITHYWDSTGASPAAIVTEALARVRAQFNAMAAVIAGSSVLTLTAAADEIEETDGQIVGQTVGTLPAAVVFTTAGQVMPAQNQGILALSTGTFINGRRLQGRQYIPGFTVGANTANGTLATTTQNAINAGAVLLGTTVVTPINQRVWHRPLLNPLTGAVINPGLSAIVTSRAARSTWSVLRSRRV